MAAGPRHILYTPADLGLSEVDTNSAATTTGNVVSIDGAIALCFYVTVSAAATATADFIIRPFMNGVAESNNILLNASATPFVLTSKSGTTFSMGPGVGAEQTPSGQITNVCASLIGMQEIRPAISIAGVAVGSVSLSLYALIGR